jgi:hypothetical protein
MLHQLRDETRPFDVHAVFTRAEEPGLFGARLIAEAGSIPKDAYVVSVEASNSRYAPAGDGIVVRAGDYNNTFSNEAERYLRVAQERLAVRGIRTQRRLLPGGTCEASAFVRLGWVATGLALPNTGYHNAGADGDLVAEMIRIEDLTSGIALAAEAAVAAGEDADESWWPDVREVPKYGTSSLARRLSTTSPPTPLDACAHGCRTEAELHREPRETDESHRRSNGSDPSSLRGARSRSMTPPTEGGLLIGDVGHEARDRDHR